MPYLAEPDDNGWGKEHDYLIDAVHTRRLPGVICPLEGPWTTIGLQYPTVDIELIESRVGRLPAAPISVDDYRALVAQIEPITGQERPLGPGAQFGPLLGMARGSLGDFCLGEPLDHSGTKVHVPRITFFGFPSEWQRCKNQCHIRPGLPIR